MKLVEYVTPNVVFKALAALEIDPDSIAYPGVTEFESMEKDLKRLHVALSALLVPDYE